MPPSVCTFTLSSTNATWGKIDDGEPVDTYHVNPVKGEKQVRWGIPVGSGDIYEDQSSLGFIRNPTYIHPQKCRGSAPVPTLGVVPPCLPLQESNYGEFPLQKDCGFPMLDLVSQVSPICPTLSQKFLKTQKVYLLGNRDLQFCLPVYICAHTFPIITYTVIKLLAAFVKP